MLSNNSSVVMRSIYEVISTMYKSSLKSQSIQFSKLMLFQRSYCKGRKIKDVMLSCYSPVYFIYYQYKINATQTRSKVLITLIKTVSQPPIQ